jgi:hypothetical protein
MAPFQTPRRSGRGVSGRPRPQINMQAKAGKKNKVAEDVLITAPIQVDSHWYGSVWVVCFHVMQGCRGHLTLGRRMLHVNAGTGAVITRAISCDRSRDRSS